MEKETMPAANPEEKETVSKNFIELIIDRDLEE